MGGGEDFMATKKKKEQHISEFGDSFKKLYKLAKPRSPLYIELMTDDLPDEWLIDVVKYRKKSGIVTDNFLITQKEIPQWLIWLEKEGFIQLTDN